MELKFPRVRDRTRPDRIRESRRHTHHGSMTVGCWRNAWRPRLPKRPTYVDYHSSAGPYPGSGVYLHSSLSGTNSPSTSSQRHIYSVKTGLRTHACISNRGSTWNTSNRLGSISNNLCGPCGRGHTGRYCCYRTRHHGPSLIPASSRHIHVRNKYDRPNYRGNWCAVLGRSLRRTWS